jgi:hypothetical protein
MTATRAERAAGPHFELVDEPAADDGPRFRLYTAEELQQLPPPAWLLDEHLVEGSLAVLYGPPGVGKSFLALAWALSLATDIPWLRWETRGGLVLYVAAEGGAGLAQRVQVYRDAHEITGNVDKARFVRESVNLLDGADIDALLASWVRLELVRRPALVVFDTLSRCMPGGDENSAQDVGRVIAASDRIRRATDAAVLIVHHTGKDGLSERGSSALRGAADTMFSLKGEDGVLELECTKQKDALPVTVQQLRLRPIGASCTIEPREGTAEPQGLTRSQRTLLETLKDCQGDDGSSNTALVRASGLPERTANRALKVVREARYVAQVKRRYVLTSLGEIALLPTANPLP